MSTVSEEPTTVAELLERLGNVPAHRVRMRPAPGQATEADVLALHDRGDRLCELVDGVLVEKAMGYSESLLAGFLIHCLWRFLDQRPLGLVAGADGMLRLTRGLVRIPDVSFISWERLPDRVVPRAPIPQLAPDLAVEILSASNTEAEMTRKIGEYFDAGSRLVWIIDPQLRTLIVYTAPGRSITLTETHTLDGGSVLPGFTLSLKEFFAKLDQSGPGTQAK
jgi:Uma2 family endonuclease